VSVIRPVTTALRLAATAILYFVTFALAYGLVMSPSAAAPPDEAAAAGGAIALVSVLNTVVLGWLVLRSRDHGLRLMAAVATVFFGGQVFLAQVETVIFQSYPGFARHFPVDMAPRILLAGVLHVLFWTPAAVMVLGKRKGDSSTLAAESREGLPSFWSWRTLAAAVLYVAVYFTFGYFVAWRNPAVASYYGGTDSGSFWMQMATVLADTPWLPLLQVLRGMAWAALALLILRALRRSTLEGALCVGAIFGVVMNAGLLIPNPFMPHDVRMAHLMETASSNFLFGVVAGWLFRRQPRREPVGVEAATQPQQVAS